MNEIKPFWQTHELKKLAVSYKETDEEISYNLIAKKMFKLNNTKSDECVLVHVRKSIIEGLCDLLEKHPEMIEIQHDEKEHITIAQIYLVVQKECNCNANAMQNNN